MSSKTCVRRGAKFISFQNGIIVGSLSESRLKSVRFLVKKSSEAMTSSEVMKIIKSLLIIIIIENHHLFDRNN
jgi:hypothetical protein